MGMTTDRRGNIAPNIRIVESNTGDRLGVIVGHKNSWIAYAATGMGLRQHGGVFRGRAAARRALRSASR